MCVRSRGGDLFFRKPSCRNDTSTAGLEGRVENANGVIHPSSKILVTGASGFVGSRFVRSRADCVPLPPGLDLRERRTLERELAGIFEEHSLTGVVHLAAQANPKQSYENVCDTWSTNLLGTVHLTETLSKLGFQGRFLYVSTGAVYQPNEEPVTEQTPFVNRSPYVASKLAAELAVGEWGRRANIETVIVRPFNHSGPGQPEQYFLPSMVGQILRLGEKGGEIEVGNLEVYRDFLHVDDVVTAYDLLLKRGVSGQIYNLASGVSTPLREILATIARKSGRHVAFRVSPERYIAESAQPIVVDLSKITRDTGWSPTRDLDRLISDLIEGETKILHV